jgi:hypothetical protein
MSGLPQFNYPAFFEAAERLREAGYIVRNPADNPPPKCGTYPGWIRLALAQLVQCDGLAYLDGWESSTGAHIEIRVARDLTMPIKHCRVWVGEAMTNGD